MKVGLHGRRDRESMKRCMKTTLPALELLSVQYHNSFQSRTREGTHDGFIRASAVKP